MGENRPIRHKKVYIYNGTAWTNISGDISAVVAGNALTGGGTDGSVTLNVAVDDTTIAIASDGNVTVSQNLTVTGDLTVSGDDITMGTNTAGNILVADGTNFNSVAVGSLSEISTVANDDVFIAVDTSGGGLKKIARSAIVAGLATSCLLYTSPSPRDVEESRMPSSA